jgi:malate dehydrogenase (oxaloacetate-decarboxylating)
MLTKEELLAKAKKPAGNAMRLHPFYQGKIQTAPKAAIEAHGYLLAKWGETEPGEG